MPDKSGRAGKLLKKRIPILSWLPEYNKESAVADLIAGLTVGLTVMPQSLAYASIAGLPTQYGLYSAFMGCLVYGFLGGCKDITIGPTALLSLMTYQQVADRNPDYAVLLCFLTGCVMILMAPLRLGVLVEFISEPVTVGFTSATSVIIIASQLKGLLGLSFKSDGFLDTLRMVWTHLNQARTGDTVVGLVCIVILLLMRKLKDIEIGDKLKPTRNQKILKKSLWLLSLSRNALIVLLCSLMAFFMKTHMEEVPIILTGDVKSGLPPFKLPPFSTYSDSTNKTIGFSEMISDLGSSIIVVPVIAVLGNVAIAKAFATGGGIDAAQELLTLGLCNLLGSFVSSMPVTGSFSRSAVNHASGVKTPLGGMYTGCLILLALGVLTPYFYYIPKSSLAAVIICAVFFMIEYQVIKPMWKSKRKDLIPLAVTFFVCLAVGVEHGILIGVLVNLVLLLSHSARPEINHDKVEVTCGVEYAKVTPSSCIFYPGVENLRKQIMVASRSNLPVVVDCTLMRGTDFTTAKEVKALVKDLKNKKQSIFFFNACSSVEDTLRNICGTDFIHCTAINELHSKILDCHKIGPEEDSAAHTTTAELKEATWVKNNVSNGDTARDCDEPLLRHTTPVTIINLNQKC